MTPHEAFILRIDEMTSVQICPSCGMDARSRTFMCDKCWDTIRKIYGGQKDLNRIYIILKENKFLRHLSTNKILMISKLENI